jgi:hypothetical protein
MKRAVLRRFFPVSGRRLWMADGALNWIQERSQKKPAVAGFLNRSITCRFSGDRGMQLQKTEWQSRG